MAQNAQNQTLYVRNLPEKIPKKELRRALYYLFSQFGHVVDVVALKTMKMRGQAFVAFEELSSSSSAMRALQQFNFYGTPLNISYAKSRSNIFKIPRIESFTNKRPSSDIPFMDDQVKRVRVS